MFALLVVLFFIYFEYFATLVADLTFERQLIVSAVLSGVAAFRTHKFLAWLYRDYVSDRERLGDK